MLFTAFAVYIPPNEPGHCHLVQAQLYFNRYKRAWQLIVFGGNMLEFGVLYRIEDLDDEKFYIGVTTSKRNWDTGYMGPGTRWNNHLRTPFYRKRTRKS